MRTLVISDLHLGARTEVDVLRRPAALGALTSALAGVDRLVLLGDTLELRHGSAAITVDAVESVFTAIGEALPAGAPIVIVPGNHDHALAAPWLDTLTKPLGLETRVAPKKASPLAKRVARLLGAERTEIAYPGLWLADGVYAFHGHYQDPHGRVPTFERIAAGVMGRIGAELPEGDCTPEDYERVLAPLYAWIHSAAQRAPEGRMAAGAGRASKAYEMLEGDGHKPIGARLLAAAFPLGIRGLNLLRIGPLSSDLSGPSLRRNALDGVAEAVRRLGIEADHVIAGHSHRTGMLPRDEAQEWELPGGGRQHNSGSWVYETHFLGSAGSANPYWPGGAILVEEGQAPRLERLLDGVDAEALRPPRA